MSAEFDILTSTSEYIAANLTLALAMHETKDKRRLRVGLLDLDLFGPSIPKLMGLENSEEPGLTDCEFCMFSFNDQEYSC